MIKLLRIGELVATIIGLHGGDALAQKKYDTGASDTEIAGNISPYSGPASAYGTIAKAQAAYFKMINDRGGINGRAQPPVTGPRRMLVHGWPLG